MADESRCQRCGKATQLWTVRERTARETDVRLRVCLVHGSAWDAPVRAPEAPARGA